MKHFIHALAIGIGLMLAAPAMASTVTTICEDDNPDVTDLVQANVGCLTFDGFANLDGDFTTAGGTDILFLEKVEDPTLDGGTDLLLTANSDGDDLNQAGEWEIAGFVDGEIYLLLFKDGNDADPANQVGYFVDEASGTYSSPFFNNTDGTGDPKDISFTALFLVDGDCVDCVTPDVTPIPLPAGAWLLLSAIGGLFGWRRLVG